MSLRITPQQAYVKGSAAAKEPYITTDIVRDIEGMFPHWRAEFPLSAHLDYRAEIVKLWQERLTADLDLTKYPECRGLREIVQAEYRGYLDGCGGNTVAAAYYFNWAYFLRLRLQTRYFGFPEAQRAEHTPARVYAPADACTAVWFEDSPDGPINGKNLDSTPDQRAGPYIPHHLPHGEPVRGVRLMGTGTAAVYCDDEPDEIFPVNIEYILPDDIRHVRDFVGFRYRYRQLCGPGNSVWVDEAGNSVAIEQSNTRMGWRFSTNGISAVTALAYTTPELQQFKLERDRLSLEKRGWGEDSPDWIYWRGCDARYRRLLQLVDEEARRGPTLAGMARLLLDPAAPFPERISCANEKFHPEVEPNCWTVYTWAEVVFGPERRTYRWEQPVQPTIPIFKLQPELQLGEDVAMQDKFREELARLTAIGKD
ncbi:hypothetical protein HQ590_08010 [bacterium]|nr:hypothetical protein [bacterium]